MKKYLTIMFIWDHKKDLLLASKYDPVDIDMRETGLSGGNNTNKPKSALTSSYSNPSRNDKKSTPEEEVQVMVKTVLDLVLENKSRK